MTSIPRFAPPSPLPSGPARLERYNETLVSRLLQALKPEPVDYAAATPLVTVLSKDFADKAKEKERWYGTRYEVSNHRSPASIVLRSLPAARPRFRLV